MNILVLDCSVAMAWCFEDEFPEESKKILLLLKKMKAVVPSIWPLEVSNVLCVAERKKRINAQEVDLFLEMISGLPIELDGGLNLLFNRNIVELSKKYNLSAYDAAYVDLAKRYKAPLASFDKALCDIAKREAIRIL